MLQQQSQELDHLFPSDCSVNVGDILDERYKLVEIVGRGGYGLVFRATDLNLSRDVAVKVLSLEGVNQSDTLQKFEQEGKILRQLHAQNTVFFYDYGQTPQNLPYIVMEFVSGQQLKELIEKNGKIPPKRTVAILTQVFSALAEAHGFGFIHRDLKPGNIMLCHRPGFPEDFVKVLDFGIAKIISDKDIDISKEDMAGTPKYMPPEQFKNETLTPLADLYSMGCIAYEMLTGIAPFEGETLHVTVAKHLFMIPKSLGPDIEKYPNLAATVFKLLEKQPEDRFLSAQNVIEALEHWNDPELIPELKNCRTKGDDVRGSSFYDDEGREPSLEMSQKLLLSLAKSKSNASEPSPIQIAQKEARREQRIQSLSLPIRLLSKVNKTVWFVTGGILVTLALVTALIVGLSTSSHESPSPVATNNYIPAQTQPSTNKFDPVFFEMVVNISADSAITAAAFGLQTRECLAHLDDPLYGLEDIPSLLNNDDSDTIETIESNTNVQAESHKETSHRRHRHSENKQVTDDNAPKDFHLPTFAFKLYYTPTNANIGFLNAVGKCQNGTCNVETSSEYIPARIIVSAPGYQTRSVLLKKQVKDLRIILQQDSSY